MSEATTLNDFLKSLPSAENLGSKNVIVSDAQGNPLSADMIALKCRMLFGADTVISKVRNNNSGKTVASVKNEVNKASQWYSEFSTAIQPGVHVTLSFPLESGKIATIYGITLDAISTAGNGSQYRSILPLMLEIPGYAPYWNPNAAIP